MRAGADGINKSRCKANAPGGAQYLCTAFRNKIGRGKEASSAILKQNINSKSRSRSLRPPTPATITFVPRNTGMALFSQAIDLTTNHHRALLNLLFVV